MHNEYAPSHYDDGEYAHNPNHGRGTCKHGRDMEDWCPSCEEEYVRELDELSTPTPKVMRGLVAAILALFLFAPTTHAAPYTPTAPVGCTITGTTGEGFPLAECENGDEMYLDLDGSINRAPGTWVLTN